MPRTAKQVREEALQLPESERAELICELMDSFGDPAQPVDLSDPEWLAEMERRGRAVLAGEPGLPWEEVRSAIHRSICRSVGPRLQASPIT